MFLKENKKNFISSLIQSSEKGLRVSERIKQIKIGMAQFNTYNVLSENTI